MGNAANCVRKYEFRAGSRCVIPVPIAHMYGFGAEFLPAIQVGASIDLQDKTNVLKYLDREKRFQPTIAFVTPAICEMLLKGYKTARTNYEVIVTSGQRISEETFAAFDRMIGGRLINQYGRTATPGNWAFCTRTATTVTSTTRARGPTWPNRALGTAPVTWQGRMRTVPSRCWAGPERASTAMATWSFSMTSNGSWKSFPASLRLS
jgi:acyl-coenzyme A synthetase/AMP-(fatty) acid ligase